MKNTLKLDELKVVGKRRKWIPGKVAVVLFLLGFFEIWPINRLVWE